MPHWLQFLLWQGKFGPAFWTVSSLISLGVNLVLIAILILLGRKLFDLKQLVSAQLVGGLHQNFVKMDQAHIVSTITVKDTIQVKDTIPVVFNLPLNQETEVKLTKDTPVHNTTIYLNGQAVPLDLVLPKGTRLNIQLDLVVPVSQTLPVVLNVPVLLKVPVDIPLDQTQLHEPFVGLQNVVSPYQALLDAPPHSWDQTPLCQPQSGWMCNLLQEPHP